MNRMDSLRSMATSAGSMARTTASTAGSLASSAMLGAKVAAPVIKEKGKYVCTQAGVAASMGKSTLESKLKKVQKSSTYQNLRQRLPTWTPGTKGGDDAGAQNFASTEKEYFKMDPAAAKQQMRRSKSERRTSSKDSAKPRSLARTTTTVAEAAPVAAPAPEPKPAKTSSLVSERMKAFEVKPISVRKTSTEIAF
ncbi:hypothetical protein SDRG_08171 [Saprolegnia diclina VS20]|uniref:Uncharacterized protein n=1 Tax=Saprolegnia diclina (strain VS20) TaxID=1156394 RepID=T0QI41_SAPDV|nr:hypothetical protein SDRG_08171 [Saprolegnia diclina VS20]EQC34401.1 hypothetical protein SDRG_08171 [Saprolegnia diclina VS20]|eukprot:XP_008612263.1 hypothetical protein SDRG_08171 [Saprolegnia diclina VS20]